MPVIQRRKLATGDFSPSLSLSAKSDFAAKMPKLQAMALNSYSYRQGSALALSADAHADVEVVVDKQKAIHQLQAICLPLQLLPAVPAYVGKPA